MSSGLQPSFWPTVKTRPSGRSNLPVEGGAKPSASLSPHRPPSSSARRSASSARWSSRARWSSTVLLFLKGMMILWGPKPAPGESAWRHSRRSVGGLPHTGQRQRGVFFENGVGGRARGHAQNTHTCIVAARILPQWTAVAFTRFHENHPVPKFGTPVPIFKFFPTWQGDAWGNAPGVPCSL